MRTRKVSTKSKKDDEVVKISKTMTTKAIAERKNAGGFLKKHLRSRIFVWDGDECDNVGDIPTEFGSGKRPVLLKKMSRNIGRSMINQIPY
ncbi:hypothetical protein ACS0TY_009193 [Phlomoides rotata]